MSDVLSFARSLFSGRAFLQGVIMGFTRTERINFRVSKAERKQLEQIAKKQGIELSALIRQALLAYIEREAETLVK